MFKYTRSSILILILSFFIYTSGCVWEHTDESAEFLTIDDSEYPYADIPRLVIETEDFRDIRNTHTQIPAKLQIWGKTEPESSILNLSIKGRGNSSFKMTKYGMKLEFDEKTSLFGMPSDRDWVLISNHADKSLLRNYITFKIARQLDMKYVPRCTFVEVFLNRDYKGLYLLSENIKVAKHRVNIPKDENHFLVEVDRKYRSNEQIIRTSKDNTHLPFRVHFPKDASQQALNTLKAYLNDWENFIQTDYDYQELVSKWIDIQEYTKYYWIEEFSKNVDSNLKTSVYFTWETNGKISMGPVWDFDLSYGEYKLEDSEYWYSNWGPWNKHLFENRDFKINAYKFWMNNREKFVSVVDSLEMYRESIEKAAKNNFKRYPILGTTFLWEFNQSFSSHQEAVNFLKKWIAERINWIDRSLY